jgi:hypothetical protein
LAQTPLFSRNGFAGLARVVALVQIHALEDFAIKQPNAIESLTLRRMPCD